MLGHMTTTGPHANLLDGWTDLWNGHLDSAAVICADHVSIRFGGAAIGTVGDRVDSPQALADLIGAFREPRPGLTYSIVEAHTTDSWGHCVWDARVGDRHVGGVDTFDFVAGRIVRVRSVTGERPMSG